MILPLANKTVLIGSPDYQSLLDGVQLINLGLTKKEDTVITSKSKIQNVLHLYGVPKFEFQI